MPENDVRYYMQKCCIQTRNLDDGEVVAGKRPDGGVNVQIARGISRRFDVWCDERNRVKKHTVTRLVERLMTAPHIVQSAMLGEVDEGMELEYARALNALADDLVERYKARKGVLPTGRRKGDAKPSPGQGGSDLAPEPDAKRRTA